MLHSFSPLFKLPTPIGKSGSGSVSQPLPLLYLAVFFEHNPLGIGRDCCTLPFPLFKGDNMIEIIDEKEAERIERIMERRRAVPNLVAGLDFEEMERETDLLIMLGDTDD